MQVDINRKKADYLIRKMEEEMHCETFSMQILFPNRNAYVAMIRDSLRHLFSNYPLDNKSIGRLIVVADELMNNAVAYGSDEGDINQFRIRIRLCDNSIRVCYEVQDTGNNLDSRSAQQMKSLIAKNAETWHLDLTRQRGRGYHLVTDICSRLEFRDAPSK